MCEKEKLYPEDLVIIELLRNNPFRFNRIAEISSATGIYKDIVRDSLRKVAIRAGHRKNLRIPENFNISDYQVVTDNTLA